MLATKDHRPDLFDAAACQLAYYACQLAYYASVHLIAVCPRCDHETAPVSEGQPVECWWCRHMFTAGRAS